MGKEGIRQEKDKQGVTGWNTWMPGKLVNPDASEASLQLVHSRGKPVSHMSQ